MKNNSPKVTLVGAGPGSVDLLTLGGKRAIEQADVILYDALVNEELLDFSENAIKVFVGKRSGFKAYEQVEINELIVRFAKLYGHVVRLKGGDSFVFGRGMEEIEYVQKYGIETLVIPGISSSIAVPALANIPITHRSVSSGFYVLSGTLSSGEINPEIEKAVELDATVVVLMGLRKLNEISEFFVNSGKGNVEAAVILNGSLPNQLVIHGNISEIYSKFEEAKETGPGIIVIGKVVAFLKAKLIEEMNQELILV